MEEQELPNNSETTEKTADMDINADETAAGTAPFK
jgi:molecular chaperone GrpE